MIATGVLFDVDGVLIDSGSMYAATWGAWADLRAVDKTLMFEGIHGERGIDTVARVAPELVAEIELELLTQLLGEHEHKAAAFPGAAELLETVKTSRAANLTPSRTYSAVSFSPSRPATASWSRMRQLA
jgi:mannitol-1-/sugar-/sorbitol-6-phosphatase